MCSTCLHVCSLWCAKNTHIHLWFHSLHHVCLKLSIFCHHLYVSFPAGSSHIQRSGIRHSLQLSLGLSVVHSSCQTSMIVVSVIMARSKFWSGSPELFFPTERSHGRILARTKKDSVDTARYARLTLSFVSAPWMSAVCKAAHHSLKTKSRRFPLMLAMIWARLKLTLWIFTDTCFRCTVP